jgi:hypothetical protein
MNGMMGSMNMIDIGLLIVLIVVFVWMAYSVLCDKPEETYTEKMLKKNAKDILDKEPAAWPFPTAETMEPERARTKKGHYVKDDPSTPENEAWVGGKAPADKPKKTKKATTKKKAATTKKSTTTKKTTVAKKRKPKVKKENT